MLTSLHLYTKYVLLLILYVSHFTCTLYMYVLSYLRMNTYTGRLAMIAMAAYTSEHWIPGSVPFLPGKF